MVGISAMASISVCWSNDQLVTERSELSNLSLEKYFRMKNSSKMFYHLGLAEKFQCANIEWQVEDI